MIYNDIMTMTMMTMTMMMVMVMMMPIMRRMVMMVGFLIAVSFCFPQHRQNIAQGSDAEDKVWAVINDYHAAADRFQWLTLQSKELKFIFKKWLFLF